MHWKSKEHKKEREKWKEYLQIKDWVISISKPCFCLSIHWYSRYMGALSIPFTKSLIWRAPVSTSTRSLFFYWSIVDLQYYIISRCYSIVIQNFYRLHSIESYYKIMAMIPCACIHTSFLLIYFIHNSLYLLIPYPYLAPPAFALPTSKNYFDFYSCESVLLYTFIWFIF